MLYWYLVSLEIYMVKLKRRLSVTNLILENNLPTFQPNAPIVIRVKVKEVIFQAQAGNR